MSRKLRSYNSDGSLKETIEITDPTPVRFSLLTTAFTIEDQEQLLFTGETSFTELITFSAPAVVDEPVFLSDAAADNSVEIQPTEYSGVPAAQVVPLLELDGVDVTADLSDTNIYQVPPDAGGKTLTYSDTAENNVVDGNGDLIVATSSVSTTVIDLEIGAAATGGTATDVGFYRRHDFVTTGQLDVTSAGLFEYEAVAPGGAGGDAESGGGGGGSGGDVVRGSIELPVGVYDIVIGDKGLKAAESLSGLPEGGTSTILFDGEAFSVLARPGGRAGGRSVDSDAEDGGGGNGSAAGGSILGAAHPTSFTGGDGRTNVSGEDVSTRGGGGGRGAGGNGTDATLEVPNGEGGPGVASEAPGVSATYGKGGDGGGGLALGANAADAEGYGNGGDGAYATTGSRDGGNGAPSIVHFWYAI